MAMRSSVFLLLPVSVLLSVLLPAVSTVQETPSAPHVASVTFLLTVNDTWYPEDYPNQTCLRTVKTPPLKPDQRWNESQSIAVGKCDHGPLIYTLTDEGDGKSSIIVTFFSSVIEDASHPSCKIQWNYAYQDPTNDAPNRSPLPGCFNAESREGYHMTYYWFHILDWIIY